MKCIKCGKETTDSNVFCSECLAVMEQYPVKPGTLAYIPPRPEPTFHNPVRAIREKTPEEQLDMLHKLAQVLLVGVLALATALGISVGVLLYVMAEDAAVPESRTVPSRRNYTAVETEPAE